MMASGEYDAQDGDQIEKQAAKMMSEVQQQRQKSKEEMANHYRI